MEQLFTRKFLYAVFEFALPLIRFHPQESLLAAPRFASSQFWFVKIPYPWENRGVFVHVAQSPFVLPRDF